MRTRIASRDYMCKICRTFIVRGSVIAAGAGPVRCVPCAEAGKTVESRKAPPPPKSEPKFEVKAEANSEVRPQSETDAHAAARNPGLAVVTPGDYRELTIELDSVGSAIADATADHATSLENLALLNCSIKGYSGKKFLNYHTHESILESLAKPKVEILKSIADMSASIGQEEPPVEVKRRRLRGVDFGDEINADRFLAHDPMCWDRQQAHHKPKSVIWIGVNLVTPYTEREEAVRWRGAAAAALADRLVQLGYSVGIVGVFHVSHMSTQCNHCHTRIIIKAPDAPMDIAAVATSIADIGFARLIVMYGSARHVPGKLYGGLGQASTVPGKFRKGIDYLVDSDITNRQAAVDWIEKSTSKVSEAEAVAA